MPQDIGPELRFARARTHVGFVSASGMRTSTRQERARTTSSQGTRKSHPTPEGEYQIELLEYEWPDLPPIIDMKDAVTRKRVSHGINYILPVDKGKNSIDSRFRTDLRAMFQEPYATEGFGYDDNRIVKSAKLHFQTNIVDTRWTKRHIREIPVNLNSESERARKLYAHSAPAGGRTNSGTEPEKLKTRSSLFLPIKATNHPEANKLRKEAEKIIKSVREDNDEYDEEQEAEMTSQAQTETISKMEKRKSVLKFYEGQTESTENEADTKTLQKKLSAADFDSYEQLKNAKPPKPLIPDRFKSEYLSAERNQEIWDWLHYGETITDFEYFLTVCG